MFSSILYCCTTLKIPPEAEDIENDWQHTEVWLYEQDQPEGLHTEKH